MSYHWNWGVFAMPVASGEGAYGTWFATAMEVSAGISAVAWVLALSIGVSVGCARSLGPSWARRIATAWVELHRNVPLLI
jgi:glutamate/aspartate transport system permease protein